MLDLTVAPPRPRADTRSVLAVVLVLVLLAEAAVRVLEPALPTPAGWPDRAIATKVEQLDQRAADGCTDVVFVGNSMARDDLVPGVFGRRDPAGRSAYNASLDAASPALLHRWVEDEVLPRTDPATVVVGVASFDVNDAASTPLAALRSYDDAAYTAAGRLADVEAAFTRHVALVRNREALRDPPTVWNAVLDRIEGQDAERPGATGIAGVIAPDGHGLSRRSLRFDGDRGAIERVRRQFLTPFRLGGRQVDALHDLLVTIEDHGADAVVLVLPVTDAYVDAHPDGAADVAAFRDALDTAVAGTDAVVVDAPSLPHSSFADPQHLNGAGADELSSRLPTVLRDAGVPVRTCRG